MTEVPEQEVPAQEKLDWFKSSFSSGGNGGCVETAKLPDGGVAMRDSKDPDGPVLRFAQHEWVAFISGFKAGEFDHLTDE